MINNIFKAYDIRGVYPKELNEAAAFRVGQAFTVFLKKKTNKDKLKLVLARDNRLSSESLFNELERGILSQGGDVVDIGLATTPLFYFSVAHYNYDGGITVTASHNPPQDNGFKPVFSGARPISAETGLKEIEEIFQNNIFKEQEWGRVEKKETIDDYVSFYGSDEDFQNIKLVVDTANSVSGIMIKPMLKKVNLVHLFGELDGTFPNHGLDPLKEENTVALRKTILKEKADLGVAFDGDGDRIVFFDEKGNFISPDLILALIAFLILKDKPGAKIVYDICSSNIVKETAEKWGGRAIMSKVGHSFVCEKIKEEDAIFGAEYSGHFFLKDPYTIESPFFVLFNILRILKKEGKFLSEIILPFRKYFHSGQINLEVNNKEEKIKKLEEKYQGQGKMIKIDGLRIDFDDWWFLVRPSNTEPVVRLMVEAKSKDVLENKLKELQGFLLR